MVEPTSSAELTGIARLCPSCTASAARLLLTTETRTETGIPYQVVTCAACGLRYTRPLPTELELTRLYCGEYYGEGQPRLLSWDTIRAALHRGVLQQRRRALLGRPPGRILDVGCGDGDFLAGLKRRGWQVSGIEFSDAAAALSRAKGIDIFQGDLASARFPNGSFDVVTFWHVLEHIPEPVPVLVEARRILRDDGLLVVEVPDSASLTFRLCRQHWFPLDVPRHLQHFTPATLNALLERVGFAPVRRQSLHPTDFLLSFMSFMNRLGVLGRRGGAHYFVSDFRRAGRVGKAGFLALGLPIGLLSAPYSLLNTLLTGSNETLTITARKVGG
jgi:SAM-dependent methyltransferase